jgi:hypothetical protein
LIGRQLEPNAAPPNVSAAVAIDADSASAFVIVYGIDELEVALEADAIGGEPFDPEEIALEYLHGLVASRRSAAGPITISIHPEPGVLRADGTLDEWPAEPPGGLPRR